MLNVERIDSSAIICLGMGVFVWMINSLPAHWCGSPRGMLHCFSFFVAFSVALPSISWSQPFMARDRRWRDFSLQSLKRFLTTRSLILDPWSFDTTYRSGSIPPKDAARSGTRSTCRSSTRASAASTTWPARRSSCPAARRWRSRRRAGRRKPPSTKLKDTLAYFGPIFQPNDQTF